VPLVNIGEIGFRTEETGLLVDFKMVLIYIDPTSMYCVRGYPKLISTIVQAHEIQLSDEAKARRSAARRAKT
jgi:hypothetical protein